MAATITAAHVRSKPSIDRKPGFDKLSLGGSGFIALTARREPVEGRNPRESTGTYTASRDGTQTRNVEPCPRVLSASIVPPSMSSTRRTM